MGERVILWEAGGSWRRPAGFVGVGRLGVDWTVTASVTASVEADPADLPP
jgi:hypothetical protein